MHWTYFNTLGIATAEIALEGLLLFFVKDDHSVRTGLSTDSTPIACFLVDQHGSLFFGEVDRFDRTGHKAIGNGALMADILNELPFKGVAINMEPGHLYPEMPCLNEGTDRFAGQAPCTGNRVGNQALSMAGIHFGYIGLHCQTISIFPWYRRFLSGSAWERSLQSRCLPEITWPDSPHPQAGHGL